MKKEIFNQPLNLDVLTEISKNFPRYANIQNLIYEQDYFMRRTRPCGHFDATLSAHDILCSKRMVHPHVENYVIHIDKGEELMAIEGFNDETRLRNYLVFVLHCNKNMGAVHFEDMTEDEHLDTPHSMLPLPHDPVNLLFFIPYRENNRENKISVAAINTTDKIIIRYERSGKKNLGFKCLTVDPEFLNHIPGYFQRD